MRVTSSFKIVNPQDFKNKILLWAQSYQEIVWLDSNDHNSQYSSYDAVLALDSLTSIVTDSFNAFEDLKSYYQTTNDYIFGYLSYDLKNDAENLKSNNRDGLQFPELYFFQPKKIWFVKGNTATASYLPMVDDEIEADFKAISEATEVIQTQSQDLKIRLRTSKDSYFEKLDKLLEHIHLGDIYEANFCQEFYAEGTLNPYNTYQTLNRLSTPPFASFCRFFNQYVLCSSPERYLKKTEQKIISQPIKGTARRSLDAQEDAQLKAQLKNDTKEQSENIMIVDLVRNDLSKTAKKASVKVEELCEVYTFKQVHQLISTVISEVNTETSPIDIIKSTFPMGSMTGAPKISAMKIIEKLEDSKRGLYSGAIGYLTPDGDFDFNVVIRSILYNSTKQYISYSVGGAITAKSIPEKEYEECLIKAKAMREALLNS